MFSPIPYEAMLKTAEAASVKAEGPILVSFLSAAADQAEADMLAYAQEKFGPIVLTAGPVISNAIAAFKAEINKLAAEVEAKV